LQPANASRASSVRQQVTRIVEVSILKIPTGNQDSTDHVGTAALGCPAEQRSAIFSAGKICRALLDRTAEGGCPHVVRGN
jgi:hypothetical protein